MLHRRILAAEYTKFWSAHYMKFLRVVSRYTTPIGKVVLNSQELARQVGVQLQTINDYIEKAIKEGLMSSTDRQLYFHFAIHKENYALGYTPSFSFLESDRFLYLPLHTQRFILHCLCEGVRDTNTVKKGKGRPITVLFKDLYQGTTPLLNVKGKKQAFDSLKEAYFFFDMAVDHTKNQIVIYSLLNEWVQTETTSENDKEIVTYYENQSQMIELRKLCYAYGQEVFMNETSYLSILKLKSEFHNKMGLTMTEKIFEKGLPRLLNHYALYNAIKEETVGALLRSILEILIEDHPDLFHEAIVEEGNKAEKLKLLTFQTFTKGKKNKLLTKLKSIQTRVKNLTDLHYRIIRSEPRKWFEKELAMIHAGISSYLKGSVLDNHLPVGKETQSTNFSFYNWLEPELN